MTSLLIKVNNKNIYYISIDYLQPFAKNIGKNVKVKRKL